MQFQMPKAMPSLSGLMNTLFSHLFPDLEETFHKNPGGYGYTVATRMLVEELRLADESYEGGIDENTDMFRLLYALSENSRAFLSKSARILQNGEYAFAFNYDILRQFCDTSTKKVSTWLEQTDPEKKVTTGLEAALVYTYLLTHRRECAEQAVRFFEYCLTLLGVTQIDDAVYYRLFDLTWQSRKTESVLQIDKDRKVTFCPLDNRGLVTVATALMLVFHLIGRQSEPGFEKTAGLFHTYIREVFAPEIQASNAFTAAEKILLDNIKYFEPRSIQYKRRTLYPQDLFVMPRFARGGDEVAPPFSDLGQAATCQRELIVAKTGMGKTAYLKMLALCALYKKYDLSLPNAKSLAAFSRTLHIPDNTYLLYVPAQMFTYCYSCANGQYRSWTADLAKLFFNTLLNFSSNINFYAAQNTSRMYGAPEWEEGEAFEVSDALLAFLRDLAKDGRLVLLLDSFDEVPSGEMREGYCRSLAAFCDTYCSFPEQKNIGAHILVSTREMSPDTMEELKRSLDLPWEHIPTGILPLSDKQQVRLIKNWSEILSPDSDLVEEMLGQIKTNHFYRDYSVNPYMLSVVCFYSEYNLSDITQRYIKALLDRMLNTNQRVDDIIYNVLRGVERILQEIARQTVIAGNPHFSRKTLNDYLRKRIDKTDLSPEDVDKKVATLHEIFVTEVGLIVPADGADNDYQFINDQIRYELAARGIQNNLERDEMYSYYHEKLLPNIQKTKEYVGFLVPLLCHIKDENLQLAEVLVSDLAFYDFKDGDEPVLIEAMLDLLLSRYGSNIVTISSPGESAAKFVNCAQRMVLLRVLSSPSLKLTKAEKEEFAMLPVYEKHKNWLSAKLRALVE